MAYAVVACSQCKTPFSVELRHENVSCPRCRKRATLATRRRLWEGEDARSAAEAAARMAAATVGGEVRAADPIPRHDDALDAAAAQGSRERNLSRRAEVVADWLCRLEGEASEERLLEAFQRAGIPPERGERERIRLLVQHHLYERRPGHYSSL